MIQVGDIVSRNKYNNDTLFKVEKIENDIYFLVGISIRLCADSTLDDLKKEELINEDRKTDEEFLNSLEDDKREYRSDFFYIPGKILHIDGDNGYLQRCLKFYKSAGITAYGARVLASNSTVLSEGSSVRVCQAISRRPKWS